MYTYRDVYISLSLSLYIYIYIIIRLDYYNVVKYTVTYNVCTHNYIHMYILI